MFVYMTHVATNKNPRRTVQITIQLDRNHCLKLPKTTVARFLLERIAQYKRTWGQFREGTDAVHWADHARVRIRLVVA